MRRCEAVRLLVVHRRWHGCQISQHSNAALALRPHMALAAAGHNITLCRKLTLRLTLRAFAARHEKEQARLRKALRSTCAEKGPEGADAAEEGPKQRKRSAKARAGDGEDAGNAKPAKKARKMPQTAPSEHSESVRRCFAMPSLAPDVSLWHSAAARPRVTAALEPEGKKCCIRCTTCKAHWKALSACRIRQTLETTQIWRRS